MPRLIRLYILQVLTGFGLSAVFVALLLWVNVANLWHLVSHDSAGIVAVVMLWVFNGIVFAGVQFAISIMRMAGSEDTPRGGRKIRIGAPVRVHAEADKGARRKV